VAYERDILDDFADARRQPTYRAVEVAVGMVVEHRASGFCGDVVKWSSEAVTLRDRHGQHRHFGWQDGAFAFDGCPVSLHRPTARREAGPTDRITASGSIAGPAQPARVAVGSRIWVEGRHDAELLELVWGDELREAAVVVEPQHGIDDLAGAVASFRPSPSRRLGVLVDHLVSGSKEQRIAAGVVDANVLVTGHPFVDVWAGIRPSVVGIDAWPEVPKGRPWKEGVCAALGTDVATFWPTIRNRVTTYADLRPELVGAVERLLDFVT